MIVKIQVRRGLSTQWTSVNPILSSGEFGYETDTGKLKIGDGSTAWVDLEYTLNPELIEQLTIQAIEAKDLAVTSATNASISESNALTQAGRAEDEADRAELAASMGVPNGGPISTTSSPEAGTTNRVYFPLVSGTYTNFSGLVVDITTGLNIILGNSTSGFQKIVVPLSLANYLQKTSLTYQPLKNLFDKDSIILNQYIGYSGSNFTGILTLSGWATSEFIPVEENTSYTITGMLTKTQKRLMYFNSSNVAIGTTVFSLEGADPKVFTTPANCSFIMFTVSRPSEVLATEIAAVQMEKGAVATTYEAFEERLSTIEGKKINSELSEDVILESDFVISPKKNLFDKNNVVLNEFIDYRSPNNYFGILSIAGYARSPFISVNENTDYVISGFLNKVSKQLMYYNSAFVAIGTTTLAINALTLPLKFTTPANCAYVSFTVALNDQNLANETANIQLEEGSQFTGYQEYSLVVKSFKSKSFYIEKDAVEVGLKYFDKNVTFLGDSITENQSWYFQYMLQRIAFKSYQNLARSGATWSHLAGTVYDITSTGGTTTADNVIWNQVNKLISGVDGLSLITPDVVVILAGTNDFGRTKGTPSTAFTGTLSTEPPGNILDVCKAIRYSCELLLANFPLIQIILVTPIQRGVADNTNTFLCGQAIKDCAGYLGANVIDAGKESGIYGFAETLGSKYLGVDTIHPSTVSGSKLLGYYLSSELSESIIP